MARPKVYLAGAITGLDYRGAVDWREHATDWLDDWGIDGYSPMRGKTFFEKDLQGKAFSASNGYPSHPLSTNKGITVRDRNDVQTCDLMLANMSDGMPSIGTAIEYGWADAFRKPVITITGDNWDRNPFNHSIVLSISGFEVRELEDGLRLTAAILTRGR